MKDIKLQKLIKLLHDGFLRVSRERENSQTIKSRGATSSLQRHFKTQESPIEKFAFKTTRFESIEKTKSIGGSKETWN